MTTRPDPIPEGYGTVTPWIITKDTAAVIDFLKAAFDAEELGRVEGAEPGSIGHAEVRIGTSIVMMFDSPFTVETPAMLRLYVADAAAALQRAVGAGAAVVTPVTDVQAWGDRIARVRDPIGNLYWLQERVEEVTEQELGRRFADPKYHKAMEQTQVMDAPGLS
ncbi:VOC family protein [Glycomyces terrestris]|uniref:VOC family protein n=1 Tax=Glycomyces terrestris TaxID=2493553 RepID=A0A426V370_9ACTN|nr:VOC family protein [Glycomyces terrestris]RRS01295.1 VOC family protein [Glycomyces terrestris]